ncbi:MAG: YfhO family protein, partial [Candidatus Sumerlaeia bacterium]|nr:YfhO family protein [Candidatus Sumerlaeia bacterium]
LRHRACVKFGIGNAGNYYLPLLPPVVLLYEKDITKQLEKILPSQKISIAFSLTATEPVIEKELLLVKVMGLDGSPELELILGNTQDGFQQRRGEIINRTLTTSPLTPNSRIHTYKWVVDLKNPVNCSTVSVVNLSRRHYVWINHIAFKPENSLNQFSLISPNSNSPTAVWELQNYVFPLLSFARNAVVASSMSESAELLAELQYSTDTVVIEDIWRKGSSAKHLTFPTNAKITTVEYRDGYIQAEVETGDSPCLLMMRQAYFKHWRAKVDGKPVATFPADLMFLGIYVPAGAKQVELYYLPFWLIPVLVFSSLSLVVAIFLCLKNATPPQ